MIEEFQKTIDAMRSVHGNADLVLLCSPGQESIFTDALEGTEVIVESHPKIPRNEWEMVTTPNWEKLKEALASR